MSVRAERLTARAKPTRLSFSRARRLRKRFLFLTYLILFDTAPATRNAIRVALDDANAIVGLAYFGRQVVIASTEPAALDAFADIARAHRGERMIVGPRASTLHYWSLIESAHTPPRVVRDRQYVMKIDRASLKPYEHGRCPPRSYR